MNNKNYKYNDGGRAEAGYKGHARDCVVRAIAIATETPYQEVYDDLKKANQEYADSKRTKRAKRIKSKGATPRNGNYRDVYQPYLESKGWVWKSTMGIGTGCNVHLHKDELPSGRLVVRVSKHLTSMIDGVIHDTWNPQRGSEMVVKNGERIKKKETRCVYGYFYNPSQANN